MMLFFRLAIYFEKTSNNSHFFSLFCCEMVRCFFVFNQSSTKSKIIWNGCEWKFIFNHFRMKFNFTIFPAKIQKFDRMQFLSSLSNRMTHPTRLFLAVDSGDSDKFFDIISKVCEKKSLILLFHVACRYFFDWVLFFDASGANLLQIWVCFDVLRWLQW